jgi:hypothetical protein
LLVALFRRNIPDPVPDVVLARLAVERTYANEGLGVLIGAAARGYQIEVFLMEQERHHR